MWFKSAQFYTLDYTPLQDLFADDARLDAALASVSFRPCAAQEAVTAGFAPILEGHEAYTVAAAGGYFVKMVEENKLLPASVVKRELHQQAVRRAAEIGQPLTPPELDALKESVVSMLLSQAFAVRREYLLWLRPSIGALAVEAHGKRADRAVALLRQAFTTCEALPLAPQTPVSETLTRWVQTEELPPDWALGTDATLKATAGDGGVIRASREDLTAAEFTGLITAGKLVTELQLLYRDALSLVLSADLSLKRMRAQDQYLERELPSSRDDPAADAQAGLLVQDPLLTGLFTCIKEIFKCA